MSLTRLGFSIRFLFFKRGVSAGTDRLKKVLYHRRNNVLQMSNM